MSAEAPKKDGKGYAYSVIVHMVGLEGKFAGRYLAVTKCGC